MILSVFAIFDSKAEAYMQPFFMQSKGLAIRAFTDLVNNGESQISKHPEDYTLFQIGSYDEINGNLVAITPMSLGNALEYVRASVEVKREVKRNDRELL